MKTENIAVFFDRDGTIIKEVGYLSHLEDMELLPKAAAAIRLLNQQGVKTIVATNQSGVARGYFSEDLVRKIHQRLQQALHRKGAYLNGIYYCPHHPDYGNEKYRKNCLCRKPQTGMLQKAVRDFHISLPRSYLIGDAMSDMETAWNACIKAVLVLSGYGKDVIKKMENRESKKRPNFVAPDILVAVQWVTNDIKKSGA